MEEGDIGRETMKNSPSSRRTSKEAGEKNPGGSSRGLMKQLMLSMVTYSEIGATNGREDTETEHIIFGGGGKSGGEIFENVISNLTSPKLAGVGFFEAPKDEKETANCRITMETSI